MMKKIIKFACVMLIPVFLSCTGNHTGSVDLKTVKVDFSEMEHISQSDGRIVQLETTDSSLLYDICRLDVHEDTLIVQSRSFLYTFAANGKFIGHISQKGRAGNEYLQISNVFFEDGVVGIYDFNMERLILILFAGIYLVCCLGSDKTAEKTNGMPPSDSITCADIDGTRLDSSIFVISQEGDSLRLVDLTNKEQFLFVRYSNSGIEWKR